eukprot:TRINITY_DN23097_c0_g2_i1.p1 TRINITY_DN23097_c0_g2~~TRINITY_DN23097_c0_g2_i1.p1  ORF type:complete len:530 (-),score=104.65 TRINITY_DN23097_c0_g2_i1:68-1597(-)
MALAFRACFFLLAQSATVLAETAECKGDALLQRNFGQKSSVKEAISDLQMVAAAEGCRQLPGQGWEEVPLLRGSKDAAEPLFLCAKRGPDAESAITQVRFLPAAVNQSVAERSTEDCTAFGQNFQRVHRHNDSSKVGSRDSVHLCIEKLPLNEMHQAETQQGYLTGLQLVLPSSIRSSPCHVQKSSGRHQLLHGPGIEGTDLLDNGALLCVSFLGKTPSNSLLQVSPFAFASMDLAVPPDPISTRNHIFVVGPESSGTRLWSHIVASSQGLTEEDFQDFQMNKDLAVFHVSFPWGDSCDNVQDVPTLLDLGAKEADYSRADNSTAITISTPDPSRFNIDLSSLVERYKQRDEEIKVLMVVRDPDACMASKKVNHCASSEKAEAEQTKAYELMLEAAHLPEVTTICYEEMLAGGASFVNKVLKDLKMTPRTIPEIKDENSKYEKAADPIACTKDVKAYLTLCPKSPLASSFRAACDEDSEPSVVSTMQSDSKPGWLLGAVRRFFRFGDPM